MGPPYYLFANGRAALRFLEETPHPPRRLVLNAPDRQRLGCELRDVAEKRQVPTDEWSEGTARRLVDAPPSDCWILSVYFGHVLSRELLAAFDGKAVNLHAALLPWNRGVHTNVWPLVEGSPAGVTAHRMVAEVDAGSLLLQREVVVRAWDTAGTLHRRLEDATTEMLMGAWPGMLAAWPGVQQPDGGSIHRLADFAKLDRFSLDELPEARRFFSVLRARTFPPHRGLRVIVDGQEVEARIELFEPSK